MHYTDALTSRIRSTSPVCVGLDPDLAKLPEGIPKDAEGVLAFNKGIIDATKDSASSVKLSLAFYEALGWEGMRTFWKTAAYAKENGMMVIADGKRGDIGPAAEAYAEAYLHEGSAVDALTVNPYLGSDAITPFVKKCTENGKGIYVLVKTANDSSGDVQDLPIGDEVVHEHVAQLAEGWGMHHIGPETNLSFVGAVVGVAYPEEMKYLRTIMPHLPFLMPDYGIEDGTPGDVRYGFLADGTGAIVNVTDGIIFASSGSDWQEAAGLACGRIAKELGKLF